MSLLRVVSYNIHKGRSLAGRDSMGALRLGLHGLRPDVLFLQEVQGRNDKNARLTAQHESLAAALRMDCATGAMLFAAKPITGMPCSPVTRFLIMRIRTSLITNLSNADCCTA